MPWRMVTAYKTFLGVPSVSPGPLEQKWGERWSKGPWKRFQCEAPVGSLASAGSQSVCDSGGLSLSLLFDNKEILLLAVMHISFPLQTASVSWDNI